MSDFEQNNDHTGHQTSSGVWSIAALSAFAFLLSVLGAKVLSQLVDSDVSTRMAYDRAMRDVAANAAQPQKPGPSAYSIIRSVGVDGITTATIPLRSTPPVAPCGDEKPRGQSGK